MNSTVKRKGKQFYCCSVSRLVLHRAAMPNSFCPFKNFFYYWSVSVAQHLALTGVYDSSFCCICFVLLLQSVAPLTSSSCHAKHLFDFFCIFLLVCFRQLSTLLLPMCVILAVYCTSCVCHFATLWVPSLTPSSRTVAALFDDFTDEVILTYEVSTARLSPLNEYRAPIVIACLAM